MTHAEQITAALENWERRRYLCESLSSMAAGDEMAALLRESQPEPAPVVGDDERVTESDLVRLEAGVLQYPLRPQDLAAEIRSLRSACQAHAEAHEIEMQTHLAARADVARLTEERDSARASFYGNAEKAAQWFDELRQARATLAAVRKVAENYHDVDQVGDPPRWKACNPCAAEILNVLDGRAWPR